MWLRFLEWMGRMGFLCHYNFEPRKLTFWNFYPWGNDFPNLFHDPMDVVILEANRRKKSIYVKPLRSQLRKSQKFIQLFLSFLVRVAEIKTQTDESGRKKLSWKLLLKKSVERTFLLLLLMLWVNKRQNFSLFSGEWTRIALV